MAKRKKSKFFSKLKKVPAAAWAVVGLVAGIYYGKRA